jgi:cytochrome c-type biogenesis protein CcmH/NrfG
VRARAVVAVLVVAFAFYAVTIGWRGALLMRDGRPAAVALGVGVLLLPLLGAWAVWREVRFGAATERLGRELAATGGLPVDDLPRRPSGRVDRHAAMAAFEGHRREVEQRPEDWAAWYRLATAYDAAGDRRRARAAARRAIALHPLDD